VSENPVSQALSGPFGDYLRFARNSILIESVIR
jgi:hypothetical protein